MEYFWCVYLVRCVDGSLYCGISTDAATRFAAHQAGKGARYTRMRGAVDYRIIACCLNRSEASRAEILVKKLSKSAKENLWQSAPCPIYCYCNFQAA